MNSYSYLLDLAIILLCTKLLGLATRKVQMPQVVGALLAGLLLGPAVAGVLTETSFIHEVAEIGVIVLMFCAGLETDIKELKASGKASFVIALCGVLVPLAGGFGLAYFFNRPDMIASDAAASIFLQNIFIGIILTATSVSITVETLKEMGKLKTRSGNAILGAAIIDDILGIIALTVVTSMADPSVHIGAVMLKIVGFFVFSAVAGFLFYKVYKAWTEGASRGLHRHVIIAFVFCLLMAYIAEQYFGVADITGAFIAGLIISNTERSVFIQTKFDTLSYMLLSPVFFASIGLKVVLPKMSGLIVAFALLLMVVAVLTKIIGCGLGAKVCGYKPYQCKRIGVGMISRGEVALIVASKGTAVGLMSSAFLGPVVIMVVFTTIITPVLLKIIFKKGPDLPVAKEKEVSSYYEGASILRGEEK
ncbi:cation:proton antiporter [Extibacter muris]|uniref:cation:proton antiporter n=1 Tax=Extibacter muris TaxID=1796622 RepID=UPI001D064A15|nr:cation:proton antiporter [Extibacter muris]MCB6201880.1 cation:proton antiporter [Extibacter muris]MCQ4663216.1 cation:proton antiporter [Extibacter muris]MCQ4692506.1 cation:proton antiporter [Extibacter muris]